MEWMGWYTTGYSGGGGHGGGGGSLPPVVRARQAEGHPGVAVYRRPDEPTPFAEVPNGEELRVLGGSPGHEGWLRVHSTRMGVQGWAKQRNLIRPQQPRALPAAVQARQADGHPAVAIYRRPGEPTPFAEVPNGEELQVFGDSPGHEGWLRVHSTRMDVRGWAKQRNLVNPQQLNPQQLVRTSTAQDRELVAEWLCQPGFDDEAVFRELDLNADGQVSLDELRHAFAASAKWHALPEAIIAMGRKIGGDAFMTAPRVDLHTFRELGKVLRTNQAIKDSIYAQDHLLHPGSSGLRLQIRVNAGSIEADTSGGIVVANLRGRSSEAAVNAFCRQTGFDYRGQLRDLRQTVDESKFFSHELQAPAGSQVTALCLVQAPHAFDVGHMRELYRCVWRSVGSAIANSTAAFNGHLSIPLIGVHPRLGIDATAVLESLVSMLQAAGRDFERLQTVTIYAAKNLTSELAAKFHGSSVAEITAPIYDDSAELAELRAAIDAADPQRMPLLSGSHQSAIKLCEYANNMTMTPVHDQICAELRKIGEVLVRVWIPGANVNGQVINKLPNAVREALGQHLKQCASLGNQGAHTETDCQSSDSRRSIKTATAILRVLAGQPVPPTPTPPDDNGAPPIQFSGDWHCPTPSCPNAFPNICFGSSPGLRCNRCGTPKPAAATAANHSGGSSAVPPKPDFGLFIPGKPGDWQCPNTQCRNHQSPGCFASTPRCKECGSPRPGYGYSGGRGGGGGGRGLGAGGRGRGGGGFY
jgi:hypothetical protein